MSLVGDKEMVNRSQSFSDKHSQGINGYYNCDQIFYLKNWFHATCIGLGKGRNCLMGQRFKELKWFIYFIFCY